MTENEIINNLAELIIKSNKSITQISRTSGISRMMIYKIIKKEISSVSSETISKLSKALNIRPDYILCSAPKNSIRIPVLGIIPAGVPIEAIEDILDYEEISPEMLNGGKEYFALKIKGDSMSPKYLNGDIVIFLKQDYAENNDDCCVYVNGYDATFKKIRVNKETGILTLQPINSSYEPLFFNEEQIKNLPVRIIGKAIEIRRKI